MSMALYCSEMAMAAAKAAESWRLAGSSKRLRRRSQSRNEEEEVKAAENREERPRWRRENIWKKASSKRCGISAAKYLERRLAAKAVAKEENSKAASALSWKWRRASEEEMGLWRLKAQLESHATATYSRQRNSAGESWLGSIFSSAKLAVNIWLMQLYVNNDSNEISIQYVNERKAWLSMAIEKPLKAVWPMAQ